MGDIRTYNRQLEDLRSQSCQSPEKSLKSLVYWSGKASFIDWFWPIESIQITYTLYDFLRFNVPLMAIVHDVSKLGKTPFIKLFIKVHEFFFKWNPHHSSIFQAHFLRSSWEKTYTARAQCPASLPLRQGETHGTRKRRSPEGDDPLNVREITWRFVASGHFSGHFSLWQLWRLKKPPCLHRYQVNHGKSSK